MIESERSAAIHTNLYLGPTDTRCHKRGLLRISNEFLSSNFGINDFDSFLKNRLERVKQSNQHEFVLFDVGSSGGFFLSDLLSNQNQLQQSTQFLINNPDFKIIAIGLTDASSPEQHSKEKPLNHTSDTENIGVQARNYYYSLHRSQPLSSFLDGTGIDRVDLSLGIESFLYFNPTVFKEVLETISSRLSSKGQIICTSYYGAPPGFIPSWEGFIRYPKKELEPWQELIHQSSSSGIDDEFIDKLSTEEIKNAFGRAIALYRSLIPDNFDELNTKYVTKEIRKLEDDLGKTEISKKEIGGRLQSILRNYSVTLYDQKCITEMNRKKEIIKEIPNVNIEWFDDNSSFILTKK